MIENSFLDFNSDQQISNISDINPSSIVSNIPLSIPSFEQDFLSVFKKNYNSASERAYRKSVFEQNAALLPANTYWSDWTTDEFNSILPANLITYKTGNAVTQRVLIKYELRNQTSQGDLFELRDSNSPGFKQQQQYIQRPIQQPKPF
jgi:hypothetical protein